MERPYTSAVLAVSLDGKITTAEGGPPRFATKTDKRHLMEQRAKADAVLIGGASIRNENPRVVVGRRFEIERTRRGQTPQPLVAVVSASGDLGRNPRFLETSGPLRLYTSRKPDGKALKQLAHLEVVTRKPSRDGDIDLKEIVSDLWEIGIRRLQCEGGGELVQRMLKLDLLDELVITLCPVVIGGRTTPSAAGYKPFSITELPKFRLIESRRTGDELYLRYRLRTGISGRAR